MKIGNRFIGHKMPPYIIADACNNFNGDQYMAIRYVIEAQNAGVDAIKFQLRRNPGRLTLEQHERIINECNNYGITYLCTPFDKEGIDWLYNIGVPALKIGSAEAADPEFIRYAAQTNLPLIISTGGMTMGGVMDIAHSIPDWYPFVMMQCTSMYPTPYDKLNLGVLKRYAYLNLLTGASIHCPSIVPGIVATALGAKVIEYHLTTDRNQPGPDQSSSLLPVEFAQLRDQTINAWKMLSEQKQVYEHELEKLEPMRRGHG